MARPRTPRSPQLPAILPGAWKGEILGPASINFGQAVQPGPPRQAVEFTFAIMPVSLSGPGSRFLWPGVLAIFVPNPLKPERPDAGALFPNAVLPSLHLSFDVTRVQFSDLLPFFAAGRLKGFCFTAEDRCEDGHWPIRSWAWGRYRPRFRRPNPEAVEATSHAFRPALTVPASS